MTTPPTRVGSADGMSSAARFEAWIPATRAQPSTSPFATSFRVTLRAVAGFIAILALAIAL
jgi:hypothetical protein